MQQLALFGDAVGRPAPPPALPERDTLFYALLLGPQLWLPASRLVTQLRESHGITARMRPTDTFHIEMLPYGFADALDERDIDRAVSIAERTRFAPFELSFERIETGPGRRRKTESAPLLLTAGAGTDHLARLVARLGNSMIGHGMRPLPQRSPAPRLALLDDLVRLPPTPLAPPLRIDITGFSLLHSHRGRGRFSVLWSSG